MPRISEFYGIFIYMYFRDIQQHNTPHIHVRYTEYKASFSIETGERLAGRLGNKQTKRVENWIAARRAGRVVKKLIGDLALLFADAKAAVSEVINEVKAL